MNQHEKMPEQTDPRGNFISTYSGARFYIDKPNVGDIPIEDIAHALSMKCRFNGHTARFYSVAEHSVYVSRLCDESDALWGLLHDISEAFVPDIPRPIKPYIAGFKPLEQKIMASAIKVYGLCDEEPESVSKVDKHIVAAEARALFLSPPDWITAYDETIAPVPQRIGWNNKYAKTVFINRFEDLVNARGASR